MAGDSGSFLSSPPGRRRLPFMTRAYVEAPASHYRLSPETWAIIGEEYRNGAMAKDVAAKWKTSPSSVYRHACRDGWTKKSMGDARARAHARMVEAEEEGARALQPVGTRALKNLFAPAPVDDPEAADPTALAQAATLASGRAMKGRLWNEAKALAGLAESYARLTDRSKRRELTVETMDLKLLFEAMNCDQDVIRERFWVNGDDDPDRALKQAYWEHRRQLVTAARKTQMALMRRVWNAERIARDAGGTVEISEAGRAAEEETARWGELTDEEIAAEGDWALAGAGV